MLLVQAEAAWAVELVHQTWQDQDSFWSQGGQRKGYQRVWTLLQKHGTVFRVEVPRTALGIRTTVPAERWRGSEPRL